MQEDLNKTQQIMLLLISIINTNKYNKYAGITMLV